MQKCYGLHSDSKQFFRSGLGETQEDGYHQVLIAQEYCISTKAKTLALLWIVFLIRGFFYSALLPVWEGYDEPYHFSYIQHLAASHSPPTPQTRLARDVNDSLHFLPLPWMLQFQAINKPLYTHDQFWKSSAAERNQREQRARQIATASYQQSRDGPFNYEAQQPPLYYILCWPWMHLLNGCSLSTQVFALRCFGILVASLSLPAAYSLVSRLTSPALTFVVLTITVVMPELYIDLARVSNEVPALPIYTALALVLTNTVDHPQRSQNLPAAGILIGFGLLTKAYFLTSIPALLSVVAWCFAKNPQYRRRTSLLSFVAILLILAVAGPWYLHVHHLTGTWSGIARAAVVQHSRFSLLSQIPKVNWVSGLMSVLISHIWFGAWSFLTVPRSWYRAFDVVFLLAAAGIVKLLFTSRKSSTNQILQPPRLFPLLALYGFFCLGLAYDVLLTYASVGVSSSTGWYIYCLVFVEAILLAAGIYAALPKAAHRWALPALIWGFLLLDSYALCFFLIPYYSGVTSHTGVADHVFSVRMSDMLHMGVGNLIARLLTNKAPLLTPPVFIILAALYAASTVGLAILVSRFSGLQRESAPAKGSTSD